MIAQTQCVGSLHAQYLGELFLWGWIQFNDFATVNLKKFLLLLLHTDNEPWQEGGQEVDIFISLIPTWGFDTLQMTANTLNQTSFLDPLASLLAALSKCMAEPSATLAQTLLYCSCLLYFLSVHGMQLHNLQIGNMRPIRWKCF